MSISKIQKGDQIVVTTGPFKGHKGVVTKVLKRIRKNGLPQKRVSVTDIKQLVDYQKSNTQYNLPGQLKSKDRLLDISNVSLVDEKGKFSKVKISIDENGKKTRLYKTTSTKVEKIGLGLDKPKALDTKAKSVKK